MIGLAPDRGKPRAHRFRTPRRSGSAAHAATPNRRHRRGHLVDDARSGARRGSRPAPWPVWPSGRAPRQARHRRDFAREAPVPHRVGPVRRDFDVEDRLAAHPSDRLDRQTRLLEERAHARRAARGRRRPRDRRAIRERTSCFVGELREEALVPFEEKAQVRELVEQKRDAVEPQAEREARVLLRIDRRTPRSTSGWTMPAPSDLDPARLLALGGTPSPCRRCSSSPRPRPARRRERRSG